MKKLLYTVLFAVAALMAACTSPEEMVVEPGGFDTHFNLSTRGAGDPFDPDNKIEKIRVISFIPSSGGRVRTNKVYSVGLGDDISHTIPTGTYDFVFIANEPDRLTATLDNLVNRSGLNSLSILASEITRTGLIPQMQEIKGVKVQSGDKVQHPDINSGVATSHWPLKLLRLAARIDVTLYAKKNIGTEFMGIVMTGLPDQVPLVESGFTGTITRNGTQDIKLATSPEYFADVEAADMPAGAVWAKRVVRVIVPFNEFTPTNTAANAMGMTVTLYDQYSPSATMGKNDGKGVSPATRDYTLPRNHHIDCAGEVTTPLELTISAKSWDLLIPSSDPTKNRVLNVSEIETPRTLNNYQNEWTVGYWSNQEVVEVEPTGTWVTGGTGTFSADSYWEVENEWNPATSIGKVTFRLKDHNTAQSAVLSQKLVLSAHLADGEPVRRELTLNMAYLDYAPPGTLGIRKSDGKLTLKGSSTYAGTVVEQIAIDDFGGLEPEPVYMTYYKWGSMIATIGGAGGEMFDSGDIVWAPDGYKGESGVEAATAMIRSEVEAGADAAAQWHLIPYGDDGIGSTHQTWPVNDPETGLGDPCAYADSGTATKWETPSGPSWKNPIGNGEVEYPFGNPSSNSSYTWNNASVSYAKWITGIPGIVSEGAMSGDGSIFLLPTGQRAADGAFLAPDRSPNLDSRYWTSNSSTVTNGTDGIYIRFGRVNVCAQTSNGNGGNGGGDAMPIRCVKQVVVADVVPPVGEIPAPTSPLKDTYVGAFWRADQTGERVISILVDAANLGYWTAQVYSYGIDPAAANFATDDGVTTEFRKGDVLLTTIKSADPAMHDSVDPAAWTTAAMNPTNPYPNEVWKVNPATASQSVKGNITAANQRIYFRVGLNSTWSDQAGYDPDNNPARYAVILLSYAGKADGTGYKHQLIHLRQGHEADRLVPLTENPSADNKAVSAYNVTVPPAQIATFESTGYVNLATNGGAWVPYPTQAGAFFTFSASATYLRRAYHPTRGQTWSQITTIEWSADQETSPANYRRFGSVAEFQQSISTTTNPNFLSVGYYADGYFDRRKLETQTTDMTYSLGTVSPDNVHVAYRGSLFFNKTPGSANYGASLFIPYSGIFNPYTLVNKSRLAGTIGGTHTSLGGAMGPSDVDGLSYMANFHKGNVTMAVAGGNYRDSGYALRPVKN